MIAVHSYRLSLPVPARPSSPGFGARLTGYAGEADARAADPASLQSLDGRTMGTTWSLRVHNPRLLPLPALRAAVQGALDTVVAQLSHWAPDSALSRFNRAPAGSRHPLPPAFAEVLARALHWAGLSQGALDPTLGPLVGLWGFGPDAVPDGSPPPDATTLAAARARCGWQRIDFDARRAELLQPGGLALDFSGIAKGYGVDAGVAALQALGLTDFLLEVGGELRAQGGRPGGAPWQVLIDTGAGPPLRHPLRNGAIATSGDRWHARAHGTRRWSHSLDPRTGAPVAHALAAVTVRHPHCIDADALATVLTVLGTEAGLAFAHQHQVAALFAERGPGGDLRLHRSASWAETAGAP